MFGLFKNSRGNNKKKVELIDLNGNNLKKDDIVLSHRYELGRCVIITGENGFEYESIETGKKVNWTLMIDAATERQKVVKLD